ncbi:MAG: hypothetical protein ACLP0J_27940 [Solirubrobacteraceae bacterium]
MPVLMRPTGTFSPLARTPTSTGSPASSKLAGKSLEAVAGEHREQLVGTFEQWGLVLIVLTAVCVDRFRQRPRREVLAHVALGVRA